MTHCPSCSTGTLVSRGIKNNTHTLKCNNPDCPKPWQYIKVNEPGETSEIEYGRDYINIICSSRRVLTEAEILQRFEIDPNVWQIDSFAVKTSEGYRKDRSVEWDVSDGVVTHGKVRDSGKMLVVPLFHVRAKLSKKVEQITTQSLIEMLRSEIKSFAPKAKKIKYKKQKGGVLYEIQLPDLQLGRMVMASEAGYDLTPDIAVEAARRSVTELIEYARMFPVERIVFPVGHDFFDSNTADNTTAHGTPQRDDPRWQRTFKLGIGLLIELITEMTSIAPVDVPIIVGNHDEERMWYAGEVLSAWFGSNPNVRVDNTEKKRKYYTYGKCLIGLTHGYWEKLADLPAIMAAEVPDLWSRAVHKTWHVGDKHHLKKNVFSALQAEDFRGVTVQIIRSIATPSVWEYDKGHIASTKAAESFVWHPQKGQIANFLS